MGNGDEQNAYSERLIDTVKQECALWGAGRRTTSPAGYVKRLGGESQQLWDRLDVKTQWKNLRDTFRRVLKGKIRSSKSGAPADGVLDESTKWVFFYRLMFLKDTMEGRPTSWNLGPLPPVEAAEYESTTVEQLIEGMCEEGDTTTVELIQPPEASACEPVCREAGEHPPPKKKGRKTQAYQLDSRSFLLIDVASIKQAVQIVLAACVLRNGARRCGDSVEELEASGSCTDVSSAEPAEGADATTPPAAMAVNDADKEEPREVPTTTETGDVLRLLRNKVECSAGDQRLM
ncbi:hypothetical protein HPB50_011808 [Hyalomma asiaticum]|uniref:Uncharacterized protein n=1 Tax=Hyalomma asiaticum TaxID=266040 RepID=A0ACB7RWW6_HYAAI|nr:hypothetical protein HPB50_011808 [Hyalomma asiaticum]